MIWHVREEERKSREAKSIGVWGLTSSPVVSLSVIGGLIGMRTSSPS
jgi:hypothetical protein